MPDKYLTRDPATGRQKEVIATATSAGAGDAGKVPALDAAGRISQTMMPTGVGPDTTTLQASETLAARDMVRVFDDAGTTKIAKASAGVGGSPAVGFVKQAVTATENGLVFFEGVLDGFAGLTPGGAVYLSDSTPGGITEVPVTGANKLHQVIGRAISPSAISFEVGEVILLAS